MRRATPRHAVAAVMCGAAAAAPASAQGLGRARPMAAAPRSAAAAYPEANLYGIVLDERGEPLAGAVVSAVGATRVLAVSDPDGHFAFRRLPYGPYLVRAHLPGYVPPAARLIQVDRASLTVDSIALTRHPAEAEALPVLAAGIGAAGMPPAVPDGDDGTHDHGEVAWRLRHLKRGVLKDAGPGAIERLGGDWFLGDSLAGVGRAVGESARLASALFAGVPWDGHVDLLTSTSFDRPEDLLSPQSWPPRGAAFVSLEAPAAGGHWTMRGAVTQGDLSSWIVAGSYRADPGTHRWETGLSYGTQRLLRDVADARAALFDGGRTVGSVHAADEWTIGPRVTIGYGAEYARYDYLAAPDHFNPRAGVTLTPTADEAFRVRASVSHRSTAPGAEEFLPPSSGLWLPPERTFSTISSSSGFVPERLDHVEVAAEREWVGLFVLGARAFRQQVTDQLVTVFGAAPPGAGPAGRGHYYVASAGDFEARGWNVSLSRPLTARLRASVDYTNVESAWLRPSPDRGVLTALNVTLPGDRRERFHDVTASVDSAIPWTATRVFVLYKINSQLGETPDGAPGSGARFDIQLTQALPFVDMGGATWEAVVAVRNLFRDEMLDASVYDELLVVRPPKRVVGGVTVRF